MRDRYQRAQVHDLGSKWKLFYWDYTRVPRQRRSKSWAKSKVPSQREAQRLADKFMERVNERNNQPHLFTSDEETLRTLYDKCREQTWPYLKNSTRKQYEENFSRYLLPAFGETEIRKLTTLGLQEYFNELKDGLSPKSVRLIHGTLRAALNQGIAWGLLDRNPAVGVKLPRKHTVKPTVLLALIDIRKMIEAVPEPTRSMITLIVFASMRAGEVLALRWKDIQRDRIIVDERVYDDEFDEVKTDAGNREVPFDRHGVLLGAIQRMWERNKKFRKPDDLVFANASGKPLDRHNLLHRHVKPAAKKLGLPKTVDFRSFRTMHASLMRRFARLEVARDNMGHAGSTGSITLDVYSKTWWEERVEAVNWIVEAVFSEPDQEDGKTLNPSPEKSSEGGDWEPFWEPQAVQPVGIQCK
ncbi:MAG TPA: tyrosine-type recombinase/integrase [Terracidiphilus sp.]|nr:tyrosine-type recombinase/integrase [Terracidiphilus sp.]